MDEQLLAHRDQIQFHLQRPAVSLEAHMRRKRIALGDMVAGLERIYLDQRFWILLRDAALGRSTDKQVRDLLTFLKSSVARREAVCPISESVFLELLKQSDDETRVATAELIDELSLGVTLIPWDDRVRQELCNSFYKLSGVTDLIPVEKLVWSKLSYVLGEIHPHNMGFEPELELAVQKAFADYMWDFALSEIVTQVGSPPTDVNWDAIADNLNSQNRSHYSNLRSYINAFRIEFEGALSLFREEIVSLSRQMEQRDYTNFGVNVAHLSSKERFEAFSRSVPTLHVGASCHAAVRWDQKRNLNGNDLFDFHHAQAALAYCDVFLTEKPLGKLLSQHHLGLSRYDCQIFWEPGRALNWLVEASA